MPIHSITSRELKELLDRQPDLPLVDVRTAVEFRSAHVAGATNLPLHRLSADGLESAVGEHKNGTVYFICKSGARSYSACQKALGFGVSDVVNVDGGTSACIASGLPIEHACRSVSLDRQVRTVAGVLILTGAVLAVLHHPYWAGLSIFAGAAMLFSGIPNTLMGDVLAKLPWNH